jgi:hypothetical protein
MLNIWYIALYMHFQLLWCLCLCLRIMFAIDTVVHGYLSVCVFMYRKKSGYGARVPNVQNEIWQDFLCMCRNRSGYLELGSMLSRLSYNQKDRLSHKMFTMVPPCPHLSKSKYYIRHLERNDHEKKSPCQLNLTIQNNEFGVSRIHHVENFILQIEVLACLWVHE